MEICLSSENITELAKSMIEVQQELTPAMKDGVNDYTQSNYATLKSVIEVCRSILLSHGIWMTQYPIPVPSGCLGLVTKIVHAASGQWQSSFIEMPLPKNDPQGYCSAITYARRYGLSALIGLTEEDDDGESAMQRDKAVQSKHQIQPLQKQNPEKVDPKSKIYQLPQLDGITYKNQQDKEGKDCVFAMGNTHAKKEFLKSSGFKWDNQNKVWWRYANAA